MERGCVEWGLHEDEAVWNGTRLCGMENDVLNGSRPHAVSIPHNLVLMQSSFHTASFSCSPRST